jgi:medium-chain acyl-[acyl-carrier-protein] hydrolase
LCIVHLPGREGRWREAAFKNVCDLAPAVAEGLRPYLTMPYALLGQSFGALVAFEVARHLRSLGAPPPLHLFVAAHRAPQLPNPHSRVSDLDDDAFVEAMMGRYGGIPAAVLENRELLDLMLPCLRADMRAFETYEFRSEAPLGTPISAFGGLADALITQTELDGWSAQTSEAFTLRMFDGGHFFVQDHRDAFVATVLTDLAENQRFRAAEAIS